MSLNKVMLIGNAGRDPDVRHLESGSVIASFTLATTDKYRDRNGELKEQTEWHNIVCWRNLADIADKYVRKGTQLYIEGKIRNRQYTDRDGNTRYINEIVADSIQLLGKKADNPANYGYSQPAAQYKASRQNGAPGQNAISASRPAEVPLSSEFTTSAPAGTSNETPFSENDNCDDLPF